MQAFWGTTGMPVNGAEVTSQMTVVASADWGAPLRYGVTYSVKTWLEGAGQAGCSAAELAFRAALLVMGKDFKLLHDDGTTSSAAILDVQTANRTRVISIAAPEAQGAEFVTRRTVAFAVYAEYHVLNTENAVVSWHETVTVTGTGKARRAWRFPINGPGIRQVITPFSLVRMTQQGEAVGYRARPKKPKPLFPDYLVEEAVSATVGTPKYQGEGKPFIEWPVSWAYVMERGDGPLVGVPSLPPGVL